MRSGRRTVLGGVAASTLAAALPGVAEFAVLAVGATIACQV